LITPDRSFPGSRTWRTRRAGDGGGSGNGRAATGACRSAHGPEASARRISRAFRLDPASTRIWT